VRVAPGITPDLVDSEPRLIVECDSWMFHAEKSAFRRNMKRYNTLVPRGWRVLRIAWEHAMKHPDYVRDVLATAARRT
jgi:very-short-patch-repair endonuclease